MGIPFSNIYPDGPGTAAQGGGGSDAGPSTNPQYPGMPVGASPVHRDVVILAAATTTLWQPSSGNRFVLASAFIGTNTAMRVALVDDSDIQGQRPVDADFAASGGASPNLVPVPYPAKSVGNALKVVTGGAGTVRVRVSGWEVTG